jgi:UDP:flavonoid glycosyltransferase YjiC (YdhE family)
MRVLFATWALSAHFNPMVPLGWALRAAGHETLVASHPAFAPTIARAGLPALPAGPDFDLDAEVRAETAAGRWYDESLTEEEVRLRHRDLIGLQAPRRSAEVMADDVVSFARYWRPDLVVFEPTSFVGPLVARLLGVPAVRHLWTADFTAGLDLVERRLLGPLFARFGLDEIGVLGDLTLDPCPPRLEVADDLPRQPIRYIPYNGRSVLPPWLREPPSRRRVCVTWGGSMTGAEMRDRMAHVPRVVRALAGLDVEVVVAVLESQRELFTELPANVRSVGPVPLHLLLPTCDAIIHQGGGGTLMTALVGGLPQLVVPSFPDQAFSARQLAATGAGRYLPGGETVTAATVAEHAGILLEDGRYRAAARELQAEALALPPPADVVPILEQLARTAALSGAGAAG